MSESECDSWTTSAEGQVSLRALRVEFRTSAGAAQSARELLITTRAAHLEIESPCSDADAHAAPSKYTRDTSLAMQLAALFSIQEARVSAHVCCMSADNASDTGEVEYGHGTNDEDVCSLSSVWHAC